MTSLREHYLPIAGLRLKPYPTAHSGSEKSSIKDGNKSERCCHLLDNQDILTSRETQIKKVKNKNRTLRVSPRGITRLGRAGRWTASRSIVGIRTVSTPNPLMRDSLRPTEPVSPNIFPFQASCPLVQSSSFVRLLLTLSEVERQLWVGTRWRERQVNKETLTVDLPIPNPRTDRHRR